MTKICVSVLVFRLTFAIFALVIEIERHIEILLLGCDCVVVPGLGGFVAQRTPARFADDDDYDCDDADTGRAGRCTMLPPMRMIAFNAQLDMNDSLLVYSYVNVHDVSYPEAERMMERDVEELKTRIAQNGSYELNDIGTLALGEDDNYVFEPCEAGLLTPELFGLGSVMIGRIDGTDDVQAPEHESDTTLAPADGTTRPSTATVISTDRSNDKDNECEGADDDAGERVISIKLSYIRNAVAAVAALIAFVLLTTPISNSSSDYMVCSVVPVQNATNDTDNTADDTDATDATSPATDGNVSDGTMTGGNATDANVSGLSATDGRAATDANATGLSAADGRAATETETKRDSRYCIVLASMVTKKNADIFIDELNRNGYHDAHVYEHRGNVRVVYGAFDNENDARDALLSLRKNAVKPYFREAWVYKKAAAAAK